MKMPSSINKVTISKSQDFWIFPPLGFLEIEEGNDGGGNNYGLYWELGKEQEAPIICWKSHEEFSLVPKFLNLDHFNLWFEETQGQEAEGIDIKDTTFFLSLYTRSKIFTKNNKTTEAIQMLEKSVELFGEFSQSWALLAENYLKINELEKATEASINSIISNYAFGVPSIKAIQQFNQIEISNGYKNHPLLKRRTGLISGGDYSNPFLLNFELYRDIIQEFKEKDEIKSALILEYNYGFLMNFENKEIQKKNKFDFDLWSKNFIKEVYDAFPERKFDNTKQF